MRRLLGSISLCLLAYGCATVSRQPWMEGGKQVGVIQRAKAPYGEKWSYVDNSGLVKRTEMRGRAAEILSGASVHVFAYGADRRLSEEQVLDAKGAPAACEGGYACKRCTYAKDGQGNDVEEHAYFDTQGRAACTRGRYAYARFTRQGAAGPIKGVVFEDEAHKPAAAQWDGVAGVHRAAYTLLTGVGDVRCGVYYNAAGKIVARRQLEGTCSAQTQQSSGAGGGFGGPPPPRFAPPPR